MLRFQIPLIKPDGQISSIRLSDKVVYAFAHGRLVLKRSREVLILEAFAALSLDLVLVT